MFDFAVKRSSFHTAHGRFRARVRAWRGFGDPLYAHHWWWFVHNVIAHPLIGLVPIAATFRFHDYTSAKINRNGMQDA